MTNWILSWNIFGDGAPQLMVGIVEIMLASPTEIELGLSLAKKLKNGQLDTILEHFLVVVRRSLWWV